MFFPLVWVLWVRDTCGSSGRQKRTFRTFFLWGVLSSLVATTWTCLGHAHGAASVPALVFPALMSAAALVVILHEAIKEAVEVIEEVRAE
eukprot:COSAG04_NODE_500_length_13366_cov_33.972488_9_plen_90_part_00